MTPRAKYDRRVAYELLTRLEQRFQGDKFEDICEGIYAVGWPLMLNEYVIPKMLETGRIDRDEAAALDVIRRNRQTRPSEDDEETWADIYELLLCYYPVHMPGFWNECVYRGQAEDWPLVPTLFRGDPAPQELERRLDRTFAFIEALCRDDSGLRERAESGDSNRFLELIAVAQHYGFPTHLLDFTRDIRIAAYFACTGAKQGGTGSILILHLPQYRSLEGIEGSPYGGQVTESAPNSRIARQNGMFIAGHEALIFSDPRTELLERYRFLHATEFSPVGGFDTKTLLDTSTADPLAAVAKSTGPAPLNPSAKLSAAFERFREHAHTLAGRRFRHMGEREYALTCAYTVKPLLTDDTPWIDRRIALFFVEMQTEMGQRDDLRDWFKFPQLARHAFEDYLAAKGEIETRLVAGVRPYLWCCNEVETPIVEEIVDRRIAELAADLNSDGASDT
jgi:hypothetical protein